MAWDSRCNCNYNGDYGNDFTKQTFLFSLTDC